MLWPLETHHDPGQRLCGDAAAVLLSSRPIRFLLNEDRRGIWSISKVTALRLSLDCTEEVAEEPSE
jgi:hypothetical protein